MEFINRIRLMHKMFGDGEGHCKECSNLHSYEANRKYYKCAVYGISASEATDWRCRAICCGMKNREWNGHGQRLIDANGPVPKGNIVTFCNGDTLDCRLDNLTCITRAEHAVMNHVHCRGYDQDSAKVAVTLAHVRMSVNELKKERKKKKDFYKSDVDTDLYGTNF